MAKTFIRKGRIPQSDEDKIQRCYAFIEREVEARDLTTHLYSANILSFSDRMEIDKVETPGLRIKRLLEMLIMRGPYAYPEFKRALMREGYDQVLRRLNDDSEFSLESKLSRIEDVLGQLCERIKSFESSNDIPAEKISDLKRELNDVKKDTMTQLRDMIEQTSEKDSQIAKLTAQLDEKKQKLMEAEERIMQLEGRILGLESQCTSYKQDIDHLKKQEKIQADQIQRHDRTAKDQAERLQRQEKKIKEGETRMNNMAAALETVQRAANVGRNRGQWRNTNQFWARVKPRGK